MQRKTGIVMMCIVFSSMLLILSPQSTSISIKNLLVEKIDQSQEKDDSFRLITSTEWQQFSPVVKKLTRVEVKIKASTGETTPIKMSIEQPLGTILGYVEVSSSSIPTTADWVSFNLQDITLTLGVKYYIVLSTSSNSHYYWYGSGTNPYINGTSSAGSGWDWCFRTYVDKHKSIFINNINSELKMKMFSINLFMQIILNSIAYEK
jgi:hypothetical protein